MSDVATNTTPELAQVEEVFRRIAGDLAMIADRSLTIDSFRLECAQARAAGQGETHISFKLGLQHKGRVAHGCLLVPLPDAIALACYLMMISDDLVKSKRASTTLDAATKDALLEVGGFIAGATDGALRAQGFEDVKVRSESCQGVRAGVRPAFDYTEGDDLLIGRARAVLHDSPPFEMILMLGAQQKALKIGGG